MLVHDKTKENESSENVTSTGTKSEATLLFHVIKQGIQSLLLRDKYLRILIAIQTMILICLLFK